MTGYAYFKDIARGRLSGGDAAGFLKLVANADDPTRHVVIGVQIIGKGPPPTPFFFSFLIYDSDNIVLFGSVVLL